MAGQMSADRYSEWLDRQLTPFREKAVGRAHEIAQEFGGSSFGSPEMGNAILEAMRAECGNGILQAFREMRRGIANKWADRGTLRIETAHALERFAAALDQAVPFNRSHSAAAYAKGSFADQIALAIQDYDAGFLDVNSTDPSAASTTNIAHIETLTGGFQQGTHASNQNVQINIDRAAVEETVRNLEKALYSLPDDVAAQLRPDIETIGAQVKKASPSPAILRHAGQSLRSLSEGVLAGLLTPPVLALLERLWSLL